MTVTVSGPASGLTRPAVWVGTSWKMNKTLPEAAAYVRALLAGGVPPGVQAFIVPPHTALATVRDLLGPSSPVLLGAQNAHWAPEGAWTGEISMRMLVDAGAQLVELGHSERRAAFGESDEVVRLKVHAAIEHGLIPLVCVGEPGALRTAGAAEAFVVGQVRAALAGLSPAQVRRVVVAYEPVWAIGEHGRAATAEEVAPAVAALASALAELAEVNEASMRWAGGIEDCIEAPRLLYGGSVDHGNVVGLLGVPHVDGVFVGRSGWQACGLLELLRLAAMARASPRGEV